MEVNSMILAHLVVAVQRSGQELEAQWVFKQFRRNGWALADLRFRVRLGMTYLSGLEATTSAIDAFNVNRVNVQLQ